MRILKKGGLQANVFKIPIKESLKLSMSPARSVATIACFELEHWMRPVIKKGLAGNKLLLFEEPLSQKNLLKAKNADALCVFIYSKITKEILKNLPKVKVVTTMSTGFDHIDLKACQARKVQVCNVPFYGENTVAEHTMALILAISRKIPQSVERTRKGDFSLNELRGFDLKGKILGVVGTGHIGQNVIRYAKAFGMDVVAYDAFENPALAKTMGFGYVPFNSLLSKSDIITFHVPYNPKTHHMFNESSLKYLKKGAVIINTSRGGVIQTEALLHGLQSEVISFAGLDVLEGECFVKEDSQLLSSHFAKTCDLKTVLQDHLLLKHPRVLVTPHNAFNSQEALQRILDTTVQNINQFLKGKSQNLVK